jgi:MFS family permease
MATITASKSSRPIGAIKNKRTFKLLLRASSVSMLGSHVSTIAYPLLVLRLTGSPLTAGCVAFAATAPSILAYLPAGALVDRWNPRKAMLVSELGRGTAIATVAVTLALGKPAVVLLIAVAVAEGVLEVVSGLAERCYLGSLVAGDEVESALVRSEARTHMVLVAGRPLGGLLFEIGPVFPFLADVLTFIYSAFTLVIIKNDGQSTDQTARPRVSTSQSSLMNDIRQAFLWIYNDKFLRMTIILFSTGTLIFQALIIIFISDAHDRNLSALAIGVVLAASGVGGAFGSATAPRLLRKTSYSWIRIQAWVWMAGFLLLILATGKNCIFTAMIMAALGFTGALGNISLDTHLMQKADRQMLARVTSVNRLVALAACALGPVLGGVVVQELGVRRAIWCLFISSLLLPTLSALTPLAPSSGRIHRGRTRRTSAGILLLARALQDTSLISTEAGKHDYQPDALAAEAVGCPVPSDACFTPALGIEPQL